MGLFKDIKKMIRDARTEATNRSAVLEACKQNDLSELSRVMQRWEEDSNAQTNWTTEEE